MVAVRKFPQPTSTKISKLAFKQRFTQEERIAIRTAAQQNPVVFDFQDLLESATFVDLSREDTIEDVNSLEAGGLLADGRASEILSLDISEYEKWNG